MGKIKKRFNWQSRQIVKTEIDETEQNKIEVEFGEDEAVHYDASNPLVLPSEKRKTKRIRDKNSAPVKILSKKKRLKLKKIVEKKLKSSKRESILEELKKVQAKPKEMEMLTSLQTIQTLGRKKYLSKTFEFLPSLTEKKEYTQKEMDSLLKWKLPKAAKRELKAKENKPKKLKRDYNIVQTESSSSEDEAESENEMDSKGNEPSVNQIQKDENQSDSPIISEIKAEGSTEKVECKDEDKLNNNSNNNSCKKEKKKKKAKQKTKKICDDIKLSVEDKESVKETLCTENKNQDSKIQKLKKKESSSSPKISPTLKDKKKKKRNKKNKESEMKIIDSDDKDVDVASEINESVSNESMAEGNQNCSINHSESTEVKKSADVKKQEPKRTFKLVDRDPEIQKQRLKLPILSEEHAVMEAINENPITIIVGPTGSGKTTQVPQFLYEAGYTSMGLIGVTEPRRIAAISMADRVGHELNLPPSKVSYQIRYEGTTTKETEIKFMTDGVLFQEVRNNHYLDNYSAIIIDEVHERSVHSDILLGLLSRIVPRRNEKGKPLKLIIMSATPRIEDFTQNENLFKGGVPPVIQIPSRLYSVSAHFKKHTNPDYLKEAYNTACRINIEQPEGAILIFLTGQQEIKEICESLKKRFPYKKDEDENDSFWDKISKKKKKKRKHQINDDNRAQDLSQINLRNLARKRTNSETEIEANVNDEDIFRDEIDAGLFTKYGDRVQPLWVLPLYSLLPSHKQTRVFQPPPEGTRLCVVATNVAETSLTIPNIKYVIDSGKTKDKYYDPVTGISSFHVTWTSQASATQRAGRAGRMSDGICYRLYSSAVYNDEFTKYAVPDIQRRPLDDVVLTMKALKVPVYTFPFPSPPDSHHLGESFKRLTVLGALEQNEKLLKLKKQGKVIDTTVITQTGRSMSYLPMAPRFAKIVLNCHQHPEIYPYVVILISALSVREIMIEIPLRSKDGIHKPYHEDWIRKRLEWAGKREAHLLGDVMVLINAVLEAEKRNFSYQWCNNNGLRHSALMEYRKLRRQLTNEINVLIDDANLSISPDLKPPNDNQAYLLGEIVFLGSKDQVARKVDITEFQSEADRKLWKNAYRTLYSDKPVFLSSASVLYVERPKYIMYQQIYESTKIYLRGITVIREEWMLCHGGPLVDLSPPLDEPKPKFDSDSDRLLCHRSGTFGPNKWVLKPYQVKYPLSPEYFTWIGYFFLTGEMWLPLKHFSKYLYNPKYLISPITLRFKEIRLNLVRALASKSITSAMILKDVWRTEPNFLKKEYFAWFAQEDKVGLLNSIWPPVREDDFRSFYKAS